MQGSVDCVSLSIWYVCGRFPTEFRVGTRTRSVAGDTVSSSSQFDIVSQNGTVELREFPCAKRRGV